MAMKIDMIGYFVADLKKMVEFYRDVMGFAVDFDAEKPFAEVDHEGVRFGFYQRHTVPEVNFEPPKFNKGLNNTFEIALDLPKFEDVDVEFKRMTAAGAKPVYEPRDEPWGMRSSMIADPEGNLIEVGSWNKGQA